MFINSDEKNNANAAEVVSKQELINILATPKVKAERIIWALIALSYATYSYFHKDFYIPSKHGGRHLQGISASLLELMLLFSALACVLPFGIVYDKRQEQPDYEKLRRHCTFGAYGLTVLGIFFDSFHLIGEPDMFTPSWFLRLAGWLGVGALSAQLGRRPPSYLRKETHLNSNPTTSRGVAYFAAFLVGTISAFFYGLQVFYYQKDQMRHSHLGY